MPKFLSRESIVAASDVLVEELPVPEWGGVVLVREMTTDEVERYSMSLSKGDGTMDHRKLGGMRARIVSWCVIDEEGNSIFTEDDVAILQKKSNRVMSKVFDKIIAMSGLTDENAEEDSDPKVE